MATRTRAEWVLDHATALPEVWAIVAMHLGLVGAWRLMLVNKAANTGSKGFLRTLKGFVVTAAVDTTTKGVRGALSDVWRLNLSTLRWEAMPAMLLARHGHACCTVRGTLVVLGGFNSEYEIASSVETLKLPKREGEGAFTERPSLLCGGSTSAAAIAVEESDGTAERVLVLGGRSQASPASGIAPVATVHLVDLATGVCTPQPSLLRERWRFAATRLLDGRVVCAGGLDVNYMRLTSAEVLEPPPPPVQVALGATSTWRELPAMTVGRDGCCGCVLSDGRFAVLGGSAQGFLSSCEVLSVEDGEHWQPMPPMHDARYDFACAAVAKCVVVAGGPLMSAEVYDEALNRWLRLPHGVPREGLDAGYGMCGALL